MAQTFRATQILVSGKILCKPTLFFYGGALSHLYLVSVAFGDSFRASTTLVQSSYHYHAI